MGRFHYYTDRALIVRAEIEDSFGIKTKARDIEIGDWIPCRLREPDGSADPLKARYELDPSHILHLNYQDNSGRRVRIKQSDTLRVYQRIEQYWVEFPTPFRIVGSVQPKRRRTRLVSYTIPVLGSEVEF